MLIATDLDGTLVPNDAMTVSARTAAVLRRADRAGVPVVFVTARPLRWMDGFWPHVGSHGMAVVSNGAATFDVRSRSVTRIAGIEPELGVRLTQSIASRVAGATFAIECVDGMRMDPNYREPYPVPPGTPRGPLVDVWDVPALKVLVRVRDESAGSDQRYGQVYGQVYDQIYDQIVEVVGATATCTWSTPGLVEISAAGVTKAAALATLCAELRVPSEEVVVFGDMPNDLAMLAWAGTSYAVANAHPEVIAAAQHLAPTCHLDGVAHVIEQLLETRR